MLTLKNHSRQDAMHNAYQRIVDAIQSDSIMRDDQYSQVSLESPDKQTALIFHTGPIDSLTNRLFINWYAIPDDNTTIVSVEISRGSQLYHALLPRLGVL